MSNTDQSQPNLQPPITTVDQALSYRKRLQALAPDVTFLMSLYMHESISPATVVEAKKAGITGIKVYPRYVCMVNYTVALSWLRTIVVSQPIRRAAL